MNRARWSYGHVLWLVIGVGALVRIVLAFSTNGVVFDLQSYALVKDALRHDPLHVYSLVNGVQFRWPYPSGFFPFIALGAIFTKLTGLAFTSLIRVPAIAADCIIAWVVVDYLRHHGRSEREQIWALCAVALGPLFIAVSGYHGQIDSPAILPAVLAIAYWDRLPSAKRAWVAGALIGIGASIKLVPLLMLVPLVARSDSVREAITVVVAAALVLVVAMAPFEIADPSGVSRITDYHSLYGLGGLSLLAQPNLAHAWLNGTGVHASGLTHTLQGHAGQILIIATVGAAALVVLWRRPEPVRAAILLWLTVFAFSINWGPRYAVWGLPFLVLAGYARATVVMQLVLLVPSVLIYARPVAAWSVNYLYIPVMIASLAAFAAAALVTARALIKRPGPGGVADLGVQP